MSWANVIEISVAGNTIRAKLMDNENPEVVKLVCAQLPISSFALHPNVSGESFLLPTSLVFTGAGYLTDRHPGAVYLYAPGQSIVITYGETNESARVNKFAQVFSEDLWDLKALGKSVYDATLSGAQYSVVPATVHRNGDGPIPPKELSCNGHLLFDGGWRSATAIFSYEASRALCYEPDEVLTCFAGIIPSGMGTGGNIFPVWMHQWCYLMTDGPNTLYRFLTDIEIPNMTLSIIVELTRNHLLRPFNHFEFLSDLGLTKFKVWGDIYSDALDDVASLEDYKLLTTALLTLVNFYHRRVQARFPFYLGKSFPRISTDDVLKISSILKPTFNSIPSPPDKMTACVTDVAAKAGCQEEKKTRKVSYMQVLLGDQAVGQSDRSEKRSNKTRRLQEKYKSINGLAMV